MKYIGFAILALLGIVVLLLLIAVIRTLLTKPKKATYEPHPDPALARKYAEKLAAMVRVETVASKEEPCLWKFHNLQRVMGNLFPLVHRNLEKTEIDGNLLYYWKGQSSERPIVLMAHQDVVPAEGVWEHEPYSGDIADGLVWGRGSGDTKCSLMAFLQAVEELLAAGHVPAQDVYLCSSCTEEFGGDGAPKLVAELKRRGVKPWIVSDEGGGIITEPVGGVKGHYAMVGLFEKGHANVKFTARSAGGHASAPPRNSPVARLAAFVHHVEKKNPFRMELRPEVVGMFRKLTPYAGFPLRLVFGNLWLFGPLLTKLMPLISSQATAMMRTTIAFTMMSGSEACNVLPQEASVYANLRFIPHQGMDESLRVITELAAKYGLETEVLSASDYSPSLDAKGPAFAQVEAAIAASFPALPAVPYVVTGGTDAKFYQEICPNCVRFSPVIYGPAQLKGMHGLNETISVDCLPGAVEFYKNLIIGNK